MVMFGLERKKEHSGSTMGSREHMHPYHFSARIVGCSLGKPPPCAGLG
jgi:hypothetical protein